MGTVFSSGEYRCLIFEAMLEPLEFVGVATLSEESLVKGRVLYVHLIWTDADDGS